MNEMVRKLNALSARDAQMGRESAYRLALMRVKTQVQTTDNNRFSQAVGKVSSWPGQREWQQNGAQKPNWQGQEAWQSAGSHRQRQKDARAWAEVRAALSKPTDRFP